MADLPSIRRQFPSLSRKQGKNSLVYLDGPGGTQVPASVINAISGYYETCNANTHGAFVTSAETDKVMERARMSMATLLGAEGPDTISLGQNMTSLAFALARGFSRIFRPGDEVVITQLDHEGNRGPWLTLRERGVKVREVGLNKDGRLDYDDFAKKVNENTRLVALGAASNALGTVNDIPLARELSYRHGAWLLIDAVHYAPHFSIDVQAWGCDFLLCSAYKFYGPHVGVLYSKPDLLDRVPTDRLRTAGQKAPFRIETGTLNHAAMAGVSAAVDFIAGLGSGKSLREKLVSAYMRVGRHERDLAIRLYEGLRKIKGITPVGQDFSKALRAPTVSFTVKGKTAAEVASHLAADGICAWDGNFYAVRAIEVLGLMEGGGVTRFGISAYNSREDVDRVLYCLGRMDKRK
jgi:cysteine desulfurase family protein (TIGR01976 family)